MVSSLATTATAATMMTAPLDWQYNLITDHPTSPQYVNKNDDDGSLATNNKRRRTVGLTRSVLQRRNSDDSIGSKGSSSSSSSVFDFFARQDSLALRDDSSSSSSVGAPSHHQQRHRCEKKRVTFAEDALVYSSNRTEDDVREGWYSRQELALFKKDRKDVVKVLKKVCFKLDLIDQNIHCLRGFEAYFSLEMNRATKESRQLVYTFVMSEQRRQKLLGIVDDDSLMVSSCRATQWARNNAMELGFLDAVAASNEHQAQPQQVAVHNTVQCSYEHQQEQQQKVSCQQPPLCCNMSR